MIRPHVLILPSWYPSSVSPLRGVFFQEQAQGLHRAGMRVGVAYPELRRLRTLQEGRWLRNRWQTSVTVEQGVPTVRHHGWNVPSARLRKALFVRQAAQLVERYVDEFGRPDLIHVHSAIWAGAAAARIGSQFGLPYIVTEHSSAFARGMIDSWRAEIVRRAYQGADRVLAVSRALADCIVGYTDRRKIQVVPNVVDTKFFSLPPWPRSSRPFTFVSVTALTRWKGLDVLLEAFHTAFSASEDVQLRIVGGGPLAGELKALARSLGLQSQVEFLGRLSREDVRREMWQASAAVLPSRIETFGVVLIEAMATGLPVVATRCGGPAEIVTDDTGWLVEPENVESLADALKAAYEDKPAKKRCVREIRQHVLDHYSEEVVTARLREIYSSVLGGHSAVERAPQ